MSTRDLSSAELEILRLIADGFRDRQIAAILHKSVGTIRTHRDHLLWKTNSHNRVELTRFAIDAGYVPFVWRSRERIRQMPDDSDGGGE